MLEAFNFILILLLCSVDSHIFLVDSDLVIQISDFGVELNKKIGYIVHGLLASYFILSNLS